MSDHLLSAYHVLIGDSKDILTFSVILIFLVSMAVWHLQYSFSALFLIGYDGCDTPLLVNYILAAKFLLPLKAILLFPSSSLLHSIEELF